VGVDRNPASGRQHLCLAERAAGPDVPRGVLALGAPARRACALGRTGTGAAAGLVVTAEAGVRGEVGARGKLARGGSWRCLPPGEKEPGGAAVEESTRRT